MVTLSHHDRMLRALALLHRCALSFQTFRPCGLEPFRLCHPVITPGHATTPVYLARPFLIDRHPFGRALTPFDAKASLDSPRSLVFFPSKDNLVHGSVQTATCNEFYPELSFVCTALLDCLAAVCLCTLNVTFPASDNPYLAVWISCIVPNGTLRSPTLGHFSQRLAPHAPP